MPLQNRVAPTGEILAVADRGLLMGNRGCLHTPSRELGAARWRSRLWICCVLSWQGIRRDPMPPGRWTALFFLDEATALAAGHRPCAYCRRADFLAYAQAWARAEGRPERRRAGELDTVLHAERVQSRTRSQVTRWAQADRLPAGVMVRHRDAVGLLAGDAFLPWSFAGYGPPTERPGRAELLTPPATVAALAHGYRPWLHPSAAVEHGLRVLDPAG